MTNPNKRKFLVIADRSGSMAGLASEMENGLNQFFSDQAKEPGEATVDYVQFDNTYEVVFTDRPVAEAKAVITPRGATALLDAIGNAVVSLGDKLRKLDEDERPSMVQVVVVTDGYENASREWTGEKIKELIKQQEDEWNWTFVYLGANQDAIATASQYGFSKGTTLTYDTRNIAGASSSLSGLTTRNTQAYAAAAAGGSLQRAEFEDEERENAV